MYRHFLRRVMGERPALWQAMLAFNGLCMMEGAPDAVLPPVLPVLEALTQEQTASLWACPALREAMQQARVRQTWTSQATVRQTGLARATNPGSSSDSSDQGDKDKSYWDFAEESRRLALLPDATLAQLTLVFGVAAHAAQLAQVVVRADRHFLQQELGEDMLLYALQRGRFQMTTPPADAAVTASADGGPKPVQSSALPQRIRDYGLWALHRLRADWPEELRTRRNFAPESSSLAHVRAYAGLWPDVKKILLKEVAPAWTPCFD